MAFIIRRQGTLGSLVGIKSSRASAPEDDGASGLRITSLLSEESSYREVSWAASTSLTDTLMQPVPCFVALSALLKPLQSACCAAACRLVRVQFKQTHASFEWNNGAMIADRAAKAQVEPAPGPPRRWMKAPCGPMPEAPAAGAQRVRRPHEAAVNRRSPGSWAAMRWHRAEYRSKIQRDAKTAISLKQPFPNSALLP